VPVWEGGNRLSCQDDPPNQTYLAYPGEENQPFALRHEHGEHDHDHRDHDSPVVLAEVVPVPALVGEVALPISYVSPSTTYILPTPGTAAVPANRSVPDSRSATISNPAKTGAKVSFVANGEVSSLDPENSEEFEANTVIEFSRGGNFGTACYRLSPSFLDRGYLLPSIEPGRRGHLPSGPVREKTRGAQIVAAYL
jgi:hypothetical protein